MIRSLIAAACAALVLVALSACASDQPDLTPSQASSATASHEEYTGPTASTEPQGEAVPQSITSIRIDIDGTEFNGTLDTSRIAASFAAQLPLTLSFEDYGRQEKIAPLPAAPDTSEAPASSSAPVGTIAYYAPANSIVLYYSSVGSFAGIMPIGTFDDPAGLQAVTTAFTATIRPAD